MLRQALFSWAFNPATRDITPPTRIDAALDWAERASLLVTDLEDTANVRLALGACAATLAGKPAAGSTQRRKRSVFCNALGYAVELGLLGSNPVDRIQWTAPAVAATPAQYRSPLGRRPYDLRHAAVSLWLNSGVPATEVPRRAGHGVAVLLKIYAHCIDGQATAANQRIAEALGTQDAEEDPGDEGDGDTEQAS